MGVSTLLNELRRFSTSCRLCSLLASKTHAIVSVSVSDHFNRPQSRRFSASRSQGLGPKTTRVSDIVEAIRTNDTDLESRLDRMVVRLSVDAATRIFQSLNSKKLSALRFSNWIRASIPTMSRNSEICSLVVDNLGRLNDYESMTLVLNEFRAENICLTRNAFGFLLDSWRNEDSVKEVMKILNGVGGSSRNSGVHSLVEMFGRLGRFKEAKLVMRLSGDDVKASYYNILIREKCSRCDPGGAEALLDEMRVASGCDPGVASHNLVISALCKGGENVRALVDRLRAMECSPDEITFEMVILQCFRQDRFDIALQLMDEMLGLGLEPRASTHTAFVKAYFEANSYEEARNYVGVWGSKHMRSSNSSYGLLAELHLQKGDCDAALSIVSEMIEKGLRPRSLLYKSLLERLRKSGRKDLAGDLENRYALLI